MIALELLSVRRMGRDWVKGWGKRNMTSTLDGSKARPRDGGGTGKRCGCQCHVRPVKLNAQKWIHMNEGAVGCNDGMLATKRGYVLLIMMVTAGQFGWTWTALQGEWGCELCWAH